MNTSDADFNQGDPREPNRQPDDRENASKKPPAPATARERFTEAAKSRQVADDDVDAEHDLWEGGFSPKAMIGSWIGASILTVAGLVAVVLFGPAMPIAWMVWAGLALLLWVVLACLYFYRRWTKRYQLTTQRIIHYAGLFTRITDRIEVLDVDDVTVEQGLVQRIMGVGTIKIVSSDRSHPELLLHGIDDVRNIADLIDNTRRKERRRRGLHIEAI